VKKISILFVLSILLFGCKDKQAKPAGMLDKKTFEKILIDVHITDAMIDKHNTTRDSIFLFHNADFNQILKNHHANKKDFLVTYKYYVHDPAAFDLIYLDIVEELSKMQAEAH
jgi:hypothetical protein